MAGNAMHTSCFYLFWDLKPNVVNTEEDSIEAD